MPRYIDAIEAKAAIKDLFPDMPKIEFNGNRRRWREENEQYLRCLDVLSSLPAVDVVERKKGKWEKNGKCNLCGEHAPFWAMASTYYESKFCPNCGARMEANDE